MKGYYFPLLGGLVPDAGFFNIIDCLGLVLVINDVNDRYWGLFFFRKTNTANAKSNKSLSEQKK